MKDFRTYRRKGIIWARPYIEGEDLSGISISPEDTPQAGGMIAMNPDNHKDKWYINAEYFARNYD